MTTTNCQELNMIGHSLNGFYAVKGLNGIQTIYCDFNKNPRDLGKYDESIIFQINSN